MFQNLIALTSDYFILLYDRKCTKFETSAEFNMYSCTFHLLDTMHTSHDKERKQIFSYQILQINFAVGKWLIN